MYALLNNVLPAHENSFIINPASNTDRLRCCVMRKEQDNFKEKIVDLEWELFDQVQNEGGRASCQDDYHTFRIMRLSQFRVWSDALCASYYQDLQDAIAQNRNLLSEKYGWMMRDTAPMRFLQIEDFLPQIDAETENQIAQIVALQVDWMEEYCNLYWALSYGNRLVRTKEEYGNLTSFETYLRGELHTYSKQTLQLYKEFMETLQKSGKNLILMVMEQTVALYGYDSLKMADNQKKQEVLQRILQHIDQCFQREEYDSALHIIQKWIEIFRMHQDWQFELTLQNEMMGLCRKLGQKKLGLDAVKRAEQLVELLSAENTMAGGTTYLNMATACKNLGKLSLSEKYFLKTENIFQSQQMENPYPLAALYNNQALLYSDMEKYDQAEERYEKALNILRNMTQTEGEMASTYISLAHLFQKTDKTRVEEMVQKALTLFETMKKDLDSHGAYLFAVNGKSLEILGYPKEGQELKRLSQQYYADRKGKES